MTKNVGGLDRIIRFVAAALIGVAYAMGWVSGTIAIVLGIVALILFATGLISFCPAYRLLGVNSCARPK